MYVKEKTYNNPTCEVLRYLNLVNFVTSHHTVVVASDPQGYLITLFNKWKKETLYTHAFYIQCIMSGDDSDIVFTIPINHPE